MQPEVVVGELVSKSFVNAEEASQIKELLKVEDPAVLRSVIAPLNRRLG